MEIPGTQMKYEKTIIIIVLWPYRIISWLDLSADWLENFSASPREYFQNNPPFPLLEILVYFPLGEIQVRGILFLWCSF